MAFYNITAAGVDAIAENIQTNHQNGITAQVLNDVLKRMFDGHILPDIYFNPDAMIELSSLESLSEGDDIPPFFSRIADEIDGGKLTAFAPLFDSAGRPCALAMVYPQGDEYGMNIYGNTSLEYIRYDSGDSITKMRSKYFLRMRLPDSDTTYGSANAMLSALGIDGGDFNDLMAGKFHFVKKSSGEIYPVMLVSPLFGSQMVKVGFSEGTVEAQIWTLDFSTHSVTITTI